MINTFPFTRTFSLFIRTFFLKLAELEKTHNFVNSAPFALSEPCCLTDDSNRRTFYCGPTQLVDEHKGNLNAQFKTQNNVV